MNLENFSIIKSLGVGATSEVFQARNTVTDRNVALKVFSSLVLNDSEALGRLEGEVQALTQLRHPNVVALINQHRTPISYALELELVEGSDLRIWCKQYQEKLIEPLLWVLAQMARGIGSAHENEILHRDLKPENILISHSGEVKISDFGLARQLDRLTITRIGLLAGSLGYMAPEVVNGQKADTKSDTFSFGVIAYEMLSGEIPFKGETPQALLRSVLETQEISLRELNPTVPERISSLVTSCLQKDPKNRPESIWKVEAELLSHLATSRLLPLCKSLVSQEKRLDVLGLAYGIKNKTLKAQIAAFEEIDILSSVDRKILIGLVEELRILFPNDESLSDSLSLVVEKPKRKSWALVIIFFLVTSLTLIGFFKLRFEKRHVVAQETKAVEPLQARAQAALPPASVEKKASPKMTPPGVLKILADDDVTVYVNDVYVPKGNWAHYSTSSGYKTIKLVKKGYLPIENVVHVSSSETTLVNAKGGPP